MVFVPAALVHAPASNMENNKIETIVPATKPHDSGNDRFRIAINIASINERVIGYIAKKSDE